MNKRVGREVAYLIVFLVSTLSIVGITGYGVIQAINELTNSVDHSRYPFKISLAVNQIGSQLDLLEDSVQLAVSESDTEFAKISLMELEEFNNKLNKNMTDISNSGEIEGEELVQLEFDIQKLSNYLLNLPERQRDKLVNTGASTQILLLSNIIELQVRDILSKASLKTGSLIEEASLESIVFNKKAQRQLPRRSQVHGFENWTDVHSTIAKVRHRHIFCFCVPISPGRPCS